MITKPRTLNAMNTSPLDNLIVVLHQPRDVVNIGGVVRAMLNTGFSQLRLVAHAPYDPADIGGIAHRSDALLAATPTYDRLDAALADAVFVVGTSARTHGERPTREDVRALAPELLRLAQSGPVALLFGPEDNGLDNAALDRCNLLLRLPVDPAYPSLNLAQAVLLLLYELRMAAQGDIPAALAGSPPAPAAQLETLYDAVEQALRAIEFVKTGDATAKLRVVRRLVQRARPDQQEAALLTAMAREVVAFLRRRGMR